MGRLVGVLDDTGVGVLDGAGAGVLDDLGSGEPEAPGAGVLDAPNAGAVGPTGCGAGPKTVPLPPHPAHASTTKRKGNEPKRPIRNPHRNYPELYGWYVRQR